MLFANMNKQRNTGLSLENLFSDNQAAEEIRCVFDDNSKVIFVKSS